MMLVNNQIVDVYCSIYKFAIYDGFTELQEHILSREGNDSESSQEHHVDMLSMTYFICIL